MKADGKAWNTFEMICYFVIFKMCSSLPAEPVVL